MEVSAIVSHHVVFHDHSNDHELVIGFSMLLLLCNCVLGPVQPIHSCRKNSPVDRPFAFPGDSTRAVLIEVFGFAFDDLRQPSQDVRRKAQKRTMNDTSTFARARFHHHTGAGRSSWTPCAVGFDRDRCERSCRSTSLLTTEGRSLSDEFVQGIVE